MYLNKTNFQIISLIGLNIVFNFIFCTVLILVHYKPASRTRKISVCMRIAACWKLHIAC